MSKAWSKYQIAIFEANLKEEGNKFVKATAGSGKTTVIEHCITEVPMHLSVLALAFNVAIKDELAKRLGHLSNVTVKTLNGFGYGACRNAVKRFIKVDKKKVENILYYDVMKEAKAPEERELYYSTRYMICKIIGLLKANMTWEPTEADIVDLMEVHGMSLPKKIKMAQVTGLVQAAYKRNWEKTLVIDYDDQISMPLYFKWSVDTYDRGFVDEAQDLTPAQIELTSQIGGRIYYVGDPWQAIYLFRGADSNAVNKIVDRMDCATMPLSVCYRCSKAVVRRAQQKNPDIEAFDGSPEGSDEEVTLDDFRNQIADGNFVLCRTTAPLVSECLRAIRGGKKATVRGREIGESLAAFVDAVGYAGVDSKGFMEALAVYVNEKAEGLQRAGREDALILLMDQHETIKVFAEDAPTIAGIKARIKSIFDDNPGSGIQFMTIHKSKGLESKRVWILRPDQLPHKLAKTDEQIKAEDNLWFVAVTRCQLDLRWVKP